jgi:hypothetical protein
MNKGLPEIGIVIPCYNEEYRSKKLKEGMVSEYGSGVGSGW